MVAVSIAAEKRDRGMAVLKEILKECVPFTAQGAVADLYSVTDSSRFLWLKSLLDRVRRRK